MSSKLRLVVLGMMGRCPFGGQTWLYLNWLRGFQRQGHDVWYVEDDAVWPYDPIAETITGDCSYAVEHIRRSCERIGLGERWAYRFEGGTWGLEPDELHALFRDCDVLLNIVGGTDLREEHLAARFRVYVETDPVIAELLLDQDDPHTVEAFAAHDAFATYGENYGNPDCGVPLNGIRFVKTRQPVDLELWPAAFTPDAPDFTTIGNYRSPENAVEWRGETYSWSKHTEWERFLSLPRLTGQPFELALSSIGADDRELLEAAGFRVVSALEMSLRIFDDYQDYFRRSRAEFTVAKDQNVRLRSGWFSERDACYLASGKPVVAQDTGFGSAVPTGEGLFAVSTPEEAAAAVEEINADYDRHARAARALAEEHFEAGAVAGRLLAGLGVA